MAKVLAMGSAEFVRLMQLGGADGLLANAQTLPELLMQAMADKHNGIVLVDADLASAVPPEVSEQMGSDAKTRLLILQSHSASMLRGRIRQVVGADLMASDSTTTGMIK